MANKKISELAVRTPSLTDLMLVGDPSTGYSYKATISSLSTLLEANIALDDLNDVTITSPTAGQVLSYNGTAWVNDTNGITGTGTTNYIPKFTSSSAIGNSIIYDDGDSIYQRVGIATTSLDSRLVVKGIDANISNKTISAVDSANSPLFYVKNNGDLYIKGSIGVASTNPDIFSSGWTGSILGLTSSVGGSAIEINSASGNIAGLEMGITGTGRTFSILSSTTSTKFRQAQANPIIFEIQPFDEKMRLDASGNLGLGTSAPNVPLEVNGSLRTTRNGAASQYLQLEGGDATGSFITAVGVAKVLTIRNNSTTSSDINFDQAVATGYYFKQAGTTKLTLDASGNLGLGTSSPTYKLNVLASAGTQAIFQAGQTGVSNGYTINSNGTNLTYQWYNGGNEAMRLDASGNLGLGTTTFPTFSNTTQLVVRGGTGPSIIQSVSNDKGSSITLYSGNNSSDNPVVIYQKDLRFASVTDDGLTGYSERMRLNSSGNLGLGTSSPQTQLDIANGLMFGTIDAFPSATYDAAAVIAKTGSLGSAPFNNAGSIVYRARVTSTAGRSSHIFYTGSPSTERMRLDESGRLGIGTTSPVTKTHIEQGLVTLNTTNLDNGTAVGLSVTYPDVTISGGEGIALALGMNGRGRSYIANLSLTANKDASEMLFYTEGSGVIAERMRITSGGNVGIGTSSPTYKLQVTEGGISFGGADKSLLKLASGTTTELNIIQRNVSGFTGSILSSTDAVSFETSSTERMRITSGGELLINTTSDAGDYKLQVNGNVYSSSEIHSMGGTTGAQIKLSGSTNYGIIKDVNSVNRIWFENTGSYRTILDLPASGTKFDFRNSAGTSLLQVFSGGSIQTAAPSGGTAKPFKIGAAATVTPTSQNRTIEIEIDGTTYYLTAKTTND